MRGLGIVAVGIAWIVLLNVLREVDQYRPRPVAQRMGEGQAHRSGNPGHAIDQVGSLGDGLDDGNDVYFLESIPAQQLGRNVSGDRNDGRGIAVGIGNAGDQVGGAGTRSRQADTDLSGDAGKTLRGMRRTLLVFDTDTVNTVFVQYVEYLEVGPTGVTEYDIDALQLKAFCKDLGAPQRAIALLGFDVRELTTGNGGDVLVGNVVNRHFGPRCRRFSDAEVTVKHHKL